MPFDLNVFRNKFTRGGARASQFEMRVSWPQQVPAGLAASADLPFLCSIAELPGSQVGEATVKYFGRTFKYAGDRQFGTLDITVLNDEDFKIRHAFESWSAAITGHATTISQFRGGLTSDSYATTAEVRQYSRNEGGQGGVPVRAYRFVGLWPEHVHPIQLNWSSEEIETFQVTLAYQWWEPIDGSTGASVSTNF